MDKPQYPSDTDALERDASERATVSIGHARILGIAAELSRRLNKITRMGEARSERHQLNCKEVERNYDADELLRQLELLGVGDECDVDELLRQLELLGVGDDEEVAK